MRLDCEDRMYRVHYRSDRWKMLQPENVAAGSWQIAYQSLPAHQRLSVEFHRTMTGSVSVTDARIEYQLPGQTSKFRWHTLRTLHPSIIWIEESSDNGE